MTGEALLSAALPVLCAMGDWQRECFVDRYVLERRAADIAAEHSVTHQAVANQTRAARRMLRHYLDHGTLPQQHKPGPVGRRGQRREAATCSACGCDADAYTDGCSRCYHRRYYRENQSAAARAAAV